MIRGNWSLLRPLGVNPHDLAAVRAAAPVADDYRQWIAAEHERVWRSANKLAAPAARFVESQAATFALGNLQDAWMHGDAALLASQYQPYAVLHDSAPVASGSAAIRDHTAGLRGAFAVAALTVDHLCVRLRDDETCDLAARWTLNARYASDIWGQQGTDAEVTVLGITHWHLVAGRIAAEWSIFDRLDVLTQSLRARPSRAATTLT